METPSQSNFDTKTAREDLEYLADACNQTSMLIQQIIKNNNIPKVYKKQLRPALKGLAMGVENFPQEAKKEVLNKTIYVFATYHLCNALGKTQNIFESMKRDDYLTQNEMNIIYILTGKTYGIFYRARTTMDDETYNKLKTHYLPNKSQETQRQAAEPSACLVS